METGDLPEEMTLIQKIRVPFHFITGNLNEKIPCPVKALSEARKMSLRFPCLHDSETIATMMEQTRENYRETGNLPEVGLCARPREFPDTYKPFGEAP